MLTSHILKLRHPGKMKGPNFKGESVGFAVDSIVGNMPLMVMPIGELLAKAGLFAGAGIMENGDISILLDMENLYEFPGSQEKE